MNKTPQTEPLQIDGQQLSLEDVIGVARRGRPVELCPEARRQVAHCRSWVDQVAADRSLVVYGLNTGFGSLSEVYVPSEFSATLMYNLIVSHACGVGPALPEEVVRASMLIRANTLARGHSGIRPETLETLLAMLNRGVHPIIPEIGSLGASGDLAPLSHMVLVLARDPQGAEEPSGEAHYRGQLLSGAEAMRRAGLQRVVLQAKEGLALNNGTAVSTALAGLALYDAEHILLQAEIALALSLEALRGVPDALDERIHRLRNQPGQIASAAHVRRLLQGSDLVGSAARVQDAYSLRCAPQVLGAARDALAFVRQVLERELNAVTDNPILFPELERPNKALSGGNFHAQPVALAADFLSIAIAEIGSIAERRIFRLLTRQLSDGLPPMLVQDSGLNAGLMIPQYVAAALVSENKTLAHPDSLDSIPTCEEQEDHVSMSANAARHARQVVWNVARVVAIELLCAAQAVDLRLAGLPGARLGQGTAAAQRAVRQRVRFLEQDRFLQPDIENLAGMVQRGELLREVEAALEPPA
ncbi:MAG: histidine ammonia-lyase [Chloroflexia bacterium]|nr:histidine ammonia-lyase [Chloroflexia bacterium]